MNIPIAAYVVALVFAGLVALLEIYAISTHVFPKEKLDSDL